MNYKMQDKLMCSLLFYLCHFSGAFPFAWKSNGITNSSSEIGTFFKISGRGILFWLIQLAVCVFFGYKFLIHPVPMATSSIPVYHFTLTIRLVQVCSTITTLLLVLPFHSLQMCASRAFYVYHLRKIPMPVPISRFVLLVSSMNISFFYMLVRLFQVSSELLFFNFFHAYSHFITASAETIISLLLFVAERTYTDINSEMKMLSYCSSNKTKLTRLEVLMSHHNITSEYVELLKDRFGLRFLNIFFWFALRMFCFGLYTVTQVKLGVRVNTVTITYHSCYITLRLFLICHHCHRLKVQGEKTSEILRKLQLYTSEELTERQLMMLETYHELLLARDLQFTACDFFNVSIQQVISVLSILVTYILVFMQVK